MTLEEKKKKGQEALPGEHHGQGSSDPEAAYY